MKSKILGLVIVTVLALSVFSVLAMAKPDKFCDDSLASVDPFVGGQVTSDKGVSMDQCDGASTNLKEFSCDGDKSKLDNINCKDFNAVCVSVLHGADHCGCTEGNHFDAEQNSCVPDARVPEFSTIAAGIAMSGAGVGYMLLRRRK